MTAPKIDSWISRRLVDIQATKYGESKGRVLTALGPVEVFSYDQRVGPWKTTRSFTTVELWFIDRWCRRRWDRFYKPRWLTRLAREFARDVARMYGSDRCHACPLWAASGHRAERSGD